MATLSLPAVLTMAEARAALEHLQSALADDPAPVVDASALHTLDTAAIAVLMQFQRLAAAAGKPCRVVGAPSKLTDLARLYGVDTLLALS